MNKEADDCVSLEEVNEYIKQNWGGTGEKVQQNDTILCNGSINVTCEEKDEKYLIIIFYTMIFFYIFFSF